MIELVDWTIIGPAFVAGLAAQKGFKAVSRHSVEFTEEWGQLFNLSVFFLLGMTVVRHGMEFQWTHWLYAVVSLTVVRMVSVALSLYCAGGIVPWSRRRRRSSSVAISPRSG